MRACSHADDIDVTIPCKLYAETFLLSIGLIELSYSIKEALHGREAISRCGFCLSLIHLIAGYVCSNTSKSWAEYVNTASPLQYTALPPTLGPGFADENGYVKLCPLPFP